MAAGVKRGRRRHAPRPLLQGDLDGLCGIYSIINALRALCPEVDHEGAEDLFDHLIQCLSAITLRPSAAIARGLWRSELRPLLSQATRYAEGEYDIVISVKVLPIREGSTNTIDALWAVLRRALGSGAVAIIGLGGKHCHWTVATAATARQLTLLDSTRMSLLRKGQCRTSPTTTRTALSHAEVFILRRK